MREKQLQIAASKRTDLKRTASCGIRSKHRTFRFLCFIASSDRHPQSHWQRFRTKVKEVHHRASRPDSARVLAAVAWSHRLASLAHQRALSCTLQMRALAGSALLLACLLALCGATSLLKRGHASAAVRSQLVSSIRLTFRSRRCAVQAGSGEGAVLPSAVPWPRLRPAHRDAEPSSRPHGCVSASWMPFLLTCDVIRSGAGCDSRAGCFAWFEALGAVGRRCCSCCGLQPCLCCAAREQ